MRTILGCLLSLTLVSGKVYFKETFGDDWESRWTKSQWKESEGTQGSWALTNGVFPKDPKEDRGLTTMDDSKFFGASASFDSFSNEGKELIVQYQAFWKAPIVCGGAYVKIGPKMDDPSKFGDPTPYNIMFGPDICGNTKRMHLIFQYKGRNVLKKTDLEYVQDHYGTSRLYRLILRPNNTVSVEVDGESIYDGNMKKDWELLQPKILDDPKDKKPSDWVDEDMIDDPDSPPEQPDDWTLVARIPDASAQKPEDWDDEEDGQWEPPMRDNPAYQGEWSIARISNPAYRGVWESRKINNPEYADDDAVYKYADFGFIGFDLWQVKAVTMFDDIIICDGDDKAEADAMAAKWRARWEWQMASQDAEEKRSRGRTSEENEENEGSKGGNDEN